MRLKEQEEKLREELKEESKKEEEESAKSGIINKSNLEKTFQELNKFADAKITMVQADLNTDEGKISLINACPDADILVNNNGGPAPAEFLILKRNSGLTLWK